MRAANILKKIKEKPEWIDIITITTVIILLSVIIINHTFFPLTDHGREYMLSEAVLNGKVPYKDINLIYFPLGYYINAIIFKFLGVTTNSLNITQTFFTILYMIGFYLCSKEFVNRKVSLFTTLFVITCCVFTNNDIFSILTPYSYSRAYGIFGFFAAFFFFLKLYKTDNLKYAYLASFAVGFSLSCKLEFFTSLFLLFTGLLLYKRLKLTEYMKIFSFLLIFPIITLSILFFQGVSFKDIKDAVEFSIQFATTDVMKTFLTNMGTYPNDAQVILKKILSRIPYLFSIILLCFVGLKIQIKKIPVWIPCTVIAISIWSFYFDNFVPIDLWIFVPYFIFLYLIFNIKTLYQSDKNMLFLLLASLLFCQREFFRMITTTYGALSLPMVFLSMIVILYKHLPEKFFNVKSSTLINYVLIILIGLYCININLTYHSTNYKLILKKGTIYTDSTSYKSIKIINRYIISNVNKNATVLILPEGNFINFMMDRNVDFRCFMMDRLYFEAYGEKKAKEMIAKTNSDYIILIDNRRVSNFSRPYLYSKKENFLTDYLKENYDKEILYKKFNSNELRYIVAYKKKTIDNINKLK